MNWQKGVAEALQKCKNFSQGNYMVVSEKLNADSCKSSVFYYGHKVLSTSAISMILSTSMTSVAMKAILVRLS